MQCCPQADSLPRSLCPHSLPDPSNEQGEVIPVLGLKLVHVLAAALHVPHQLPFQSNQARAQAVRVGARQSRSKVIFQVIFNFFLQELQLLCRLLSDCQSLNLKS